MNYKTLLIKHKLVEIKELPTVEYTEITLNERFSNKIHFKCLPAFDTRWNYPMKTVKRIYFTNYSGSLSKRFTDLASKSFQEDVNSGFRKKIPQRNERIGDTQWWTTACEWIPLPDDRIHSPIKLFSAPDYTVTTTENYHGKPESLKNQRTVLLQKSSVTVPKSMSYGFNHLNTTSLKMSQNSLPNSERLAKKPINSVSDLRKKLLDIELDKYMARCLLTKVRREPTLKEKRYTVLLPKSLVTIPGRRSFCVSETDSQKISQKRFSGVSPGYKRMVEDYLNEGSDLKKKHLDDELDKYMGDLQITKVQPMEI